MGDEDGNKTKDSGKKRQINRRIREKRRSTGVIVLPGAPEEEETEDLKTAALNAAANEAALAENEPNFQSNPSPEFTLEKALDDIREYQDAIQQWQNVYNQICEEVSVLVAENQRLINENTKVKQENQNLHKILRNYTNKQ